MKTEEATSPSPRTRRRRLANLSNVRWALADTLRALEADAIDPGKGRILIYGYSVLAGIIETEREQGDLVARIAKLEAAIAALREEGPVRHPGAL